jgi:hypothetical protein
MTVASGNMRGKSSRESARNRIPSFAQVSDGIVAGNARIKMVLMARVRVSEERLALL